MTDNSFEKLTRVARYEFVSLRSPRCLDLIFEINVSQEKEHPIFAVQKEAECLVEKAWDCKTEEKFKCIIEKQRQLNFRLEQIRKTWETERIERLADLLRKSKNTVLFGGSNIHAESRIPHMLVKLESQGLLKTIITQNMDGLFQEAGIRNVVELNIENFDSIENAIQIIESADLLIISDITDIVNQVSSLDISKAMHCLSMSLENFRGGNMVIVNTNEIDLKLSDWIESGNVYTPNGFPPRPRYKYPELFIRDTLDNTLNGVLKLLQNDCGNGNRQQTHKNIL